MSSARIRLLRCLDETPQSPCELTDVLSLSRRGVQRNLSKLVERGWAEKVDGEYRITTNGRLITRQYADFCATLGTIGDNEPFFKHLPDCDHTPSPEWLHDAEILVARPEQPHAPIRKYVSGFQTSSATTIRSILPVLNQCFTDLHEGLTERSIETELILGEPILERAQPFKAFESVLSPDTVSLYAHPETIEFGLTLSDHCGFMSAHDEQGRIRACIECTDPAFLDWAMELYRSYRNDSRALDPTELISIN